ncbi:MAG: phenylalanine--tRNA ligase subunit alpha [Candidatus Bipolaricaulaceae bacterium]
MDVNSLAERADQARRDWRRAVAEVQDPQELESLRIKFLGRKGRITALLASLRDLPAEQRAEAGKFLNALKDEVTRELGDRRAALADAAAQQRLQAEHYDFTLPGVWRPTGHLHPLTQARLEIEDIFLRLGFDVATGPEVETDYHNFGALNMPPDHPARDEWDSFYIDDQRLLRTHTSPVQIRVMKSRRPPVRIICPGRCYRRDTPDATHAPVFHQVELLWVEEGLTMASLKWVIESFVREFFGPDYAWRLLADYFPFTEPSAQVHIRAPGGEWLEIMGAGMVHPAVLAEVGYDPERVTGFAFGLGVERMAMLKYGIEDIRLFYQPDVRFVTQF